MPIHPTTTRALQRYAQQRDRDPLAAHTEAFFVFDYGRPAATRSVEYAFKLMRCRLKWHSRGGHPAPRIHDLRHSFVCKRLERWHIEGVDIDRNILALSTYVGHAKVTDTYWYVTATPELLAVAAQRFVRLMSTATRMSFPTLLQKFFVERLMQQQRVSACTVAAYRDSFRLLLTFAHRRLGKPPSDITLEDLNPALILDFLKHLETERGNCARTRNARFAAIRSFMEYVAFQEPSALAMAQSVLAIPGPLVSALAPQLHSTEATFHNCEPWIVSSNGHRSKRSLKMVRLGRHIRI